MKIEKLTLGTFQKRCEAQGVEPFRTLAEALDEVGTYDDRAELAALAELRDVTPTGTLTATLAYVSKLRETIRAHAEKPAPAQVVRRAVTGPLPGGKTFTVAGGKVVFLTARELQLCATSKCTPETYALLKSRSAPTPKKK